MLRVAAAIAAVTLVWIAAASRVPDHTRLPLSAVVPGAVVSQPFGCTALELEPFDPFCPTHHVHTGIDLAAATGTPVFAATAGVARVGWDPQGAGLFVAVTLDGGVRILYCHLSVAAVATGQAVTPGMRIGEVGATGLATGPHVHFQVQVDGRYVDPAKWLQSGRP
jgi:murein DD-endopeptidase MepM/ murein hydrolase activator NlpD